MSIPFLRILRVATKVLVLLKAVLTAVTKSKTWSNKG